MADTSVEIVEDVSEGMLKLRRPTSGPLARFTTTELLAQAGDLRETFTDASSRLTYGAIVVEFFNRWTPWIDSAVTKRSPAGAAGEEFRERLRAAFVKKVTEGILTRLDDPKAWGAYLGTTMNNLAVDLVRSRPLERDPLANTVAASDLASGSGSTEEPNQDEFIYQQIRTEVIVLSSGDYQPLETFDLYFVDGCTIDQIAARRSIGARAAERATKRACELMATAADKFGWSRFADECRRRSQSLKGRKR